MERTKTINYIKSLKTTIPEALLKDSKELADAEGYLAKLDAEIAKAEAAKKKKMEAEAKAKAKRMEKSKSQYEALVAKCYDLREEIMTVQPTLEVEFKRVVGDMRLGLTQAVGNYKPKK